MMKHRILELLLYGTGPLAIFISAPILARGLGPVGRGELGVAQSVASFALALGTLGQAEVLLADRRNGNGNLRVSSRISLAGGIVSAIVGALFLTAMNIDWPLIAAAVVLIPILSQSQLWRTIAISNQHLRAPALNNFFAALLRVILLALLAISPCLTTGTSMFAIQLSASIAAILALGRIAYRGDNRQLKIAQPNRYLSTIKKGLPVVAFTLLTSVTLGSGAIALQLFSDPVSVGMFAAASSLSMAVLSISGAFKSRVQAAVFLPGSRKRVQRELLVIIAVGIAGSTIAIAAAPQIVKILLGREFESAIPLLRVLALSCIGLLVLDTMHGLLAAVGKRNNMVIIGAIGAISTLISLVLLVPSFGAMGAAISTVISYSIASLAGWLSVRSKLE